MINVIFLAIAIEANGLSTVECSTEDQCASASLSVLEIDQRGAPALLLLCQCLPGPKCLIRLTRETNCTVNSNRMSKVKCSIQHVLLLI